MIFKSLVTFLLFLIAPDRWSLFFILLCLITAVITAVIIKKTNIRIISFIPFILLCLSFFFLISKTL